MDGVDMSKKPVPAEPKTERPTLIFRIGDYAVKLPLPADFVLVTEDEPDFSRVPVKAYLKP